MTIHIVCDLIHVLEYLWKAAWSFFEPGDPDAEDWVAEQAAKILEGKTAQVAAGIRRRATTFRYTGAEREGADECARHLAAKNPGWTTPPPWRPAGLSPHRGHRRRVQMARQGQSGMRCRPCCRMCPRSCGN